MSRHPTSASETGLSSMPRARPWVAWRPGSPTRSEERRVGKECRSLCDWSSDVCSSDLSMKTYVATPNERQRDWFVVDAQGKTLGRLATGIADKIGRASCRERV